MLLAKVCEVKFARRNPKPGRPASRRMLCTNNVQLLNSVEGRTVLNYRPPRQAPDYNPNQENLIITWDILMQDFRTINCDTVDLITTLELFTTGKKLEILYPFNVHKRNRVIYFDYMLNHIHRDDVLWRPRVNRMITNHRNKYCDLLLSIEKL